jgi:7-cyano-7-deazaguanine reductase
MSKSQISNLGLQQGRKQQAGRRAQSAGRNPKSRIKNQKSELLSGLTLLGKDVRQPTRQLETFPNQHPGRRYTVTLVCPEFTCVCPATGQPDFATITIKYIPDQRIVESKSLKLYLWSFRDEGHFHEHVTNTILDDLVKALDPISCEVVGTFNVRGGISITVEAKYQKGEG